MVAPRLSASPLWPRIRFGYLERRITREAHAVTMNPLRWKLASFAALTVDELYAALQLRQIVFIVEQSCVYLDADGEDREAEHLLGWRDGELAPELAAYARLFAPGVKYTEA